MSTVGNAQNMKIWLKCTNLNGFNHVNRRKCTEYENMA